MYEKLARGHATAFISGLQRVGCGATPSVAMEERTSVRSETFDSIMALATTLAYLTCFSCSTGSPLLMMGPPKVIQSRKSL